MPPECAGLRLDQALAQLLPEYSRSRMQAWLRDERVQLDGAAAKPKHKVWGGERVRVDAPPDPGAGSDRAEAIALAVVYEDDDLIVIDKPVGLVVHPGSGNRSGTLVNALLHHAPALATLPRAGLVHRLDKDTSGLLVVARTEAARASLVRQMQARSVERRYLAVVHGRVATGGTVDAPVGRHPVNRTRMAVIARGRPARTHYRVVERFAAATLLECKLDTGRTHQIRVHMQSIGHALIGDPAYGASARGKDGVRFPRQALHARELALVHPASGATMRWVSEIPDDISALLATLRVKQASAGKRG